MFLPESQKKLTNVSTITLKKFGIKFSLAIYPNKLYEYRNKITTNFNEILHTTEIFSNVSKGELCSDKNLKLFNKNKEEIIKEILEKGTEQKNEKTRSFELEQTICEISNFLQKKLLMDGKMLSIDRIKEIVKTNKIEIGNAKIQGQEILRRLVENGFDKRKMKIRIKRNEKIIEYENKILENDILYLNSEEYPKFKIFCDENNLKFIIEQEDEISDEEIC